MDYFFATIYRIPQIVKIYRTKNATGLSSYSYITHNGAYISFMMYLIGTGQFRNEWVLCSYYFMGISQNILIYIMKKHYAFKKDISNKDNTDIHISVVEHISQYRTDYLKRRQWYKNHMTCNKKIR